MTLYYTGMRLGEIAMLQVKDVKDGLIHIRPKTFAFREKEISWKPKTKKSRMIPVVPDLAPLLEAAMKGKRKEDLIFTSRKGPLDKGLNDHLKKVAGADDVTSHTFRHTFISHALNRWGLPLSVVQKWAGHESIKVTQGYIHTQTDDLLTAAAAIPSRTSGMNPGK